MHRTEGCVGEGPGRARGAGSTPMSFQMGGMDLVKYIVKFNIFLKSTTFSTTVKATSSSGASFPGGLQLRPVAAGVPHGEEGSKAAPAQTRPHPGAKCPSKPAHPLTQLTCACDAQEEVMNMY